MWIKHLAVPIVSGFWTLILLNMGYLRSNGDILVFVWHVIGIVNIYVYYEWLSADIRTFHSYIIYMQYL